MDRFRIQVSTKNQPSPTKPISETPISETKSIKNITNRDRLFGGYRSSKDIPAMSGPARRQAEIFFEDLEMFWAKVHFWVYSERFTHRKSLKIPPAAGEISTPFH